VVVGYNDFQVALSLIDPEAFCWTEQEGTVSLQSGGWRRTIAMDVSADASIIIGTGTDPATTGS
jgi:hypothetical protein